MLVAEMAVNLHRQRAAVLVSKPPGDGGNVNAALNAAGGKQMPQIVMGQMSDTPTLFSAAFIANSDCVTRITRASAGPSGR